ncbi:NAD(+) synthase, partial [Niveibacterium sp. 24ML]|uniref:NAD(+) synthase n=1 Tax=Niveibacterium sp. 24ML TaxID=2985512 RepID=UPI00226D4F63
LALPAPARRTQTPPLLHHSVGHQQLCRNLGIELLTHPIREIVAAFESGFAQSTGAAPQGLKLENLQARVRGTILMEFSNAHGHLLLTTGNKSEISVGYCTLYGDTNGGMGLIGDLYKTEVFELCRHINAADGREVIPRAIIDKEPSAELAPGQKDTDSLPPYPVLNDILKRRPARRGRTSCSAGPHGRPHRHRRRPRADCPHQEHDRSQRVQAAPGASDPAAALTRLWQRTTDADRGASHLLISPDTPDDYLRYRSLIHAQSLSSMRSIRFCQNT